MAMNRTYSLTTAEINNNNSIFLCVCVYVYVNASLFVYVCHYALVGESLYHAIFMNEMSFCAVYFYCKPLVCLIAMSTANCN